MRTFQGFKRSTLKNGNLHLWKFENLLWSAYTRPFLASGYCQGSVKTKDLNGALRYYPTLGYCKNHSYWIVKIQGKTEAERANKELLQA